MTTILVTRPASQAAELSARLRTRGIDVVEVPTVAIDAASAAAELDGMLDRLDGADWLVLTSANGADALVDRLRQRRTTLPPGARVAAVGPATAATLERAGIRVDHVPDRHLTVAIADGLGELAGRRVVLARADAATPDLRETLLRRGAHVTECVAYRTVEGPPSSRDLLRAALRRPLDGVAFTSGSTVRGLLHLASERDEPIVRSLAAFCIGPVTASVARRAGMQVAAVAEVHTAAGLATTIAEHYDREIA